VLVQLAKSNTTETQKAIIQLAIGAFFFACRSCEYLKVENAEERRSDILRLRNIRFLKRGKVVKHDDKIVHLADCVSITFEMQKKDEKDDTVTQHRSDDELLCPVKIWVALVRRVRSYEGSDDDTPVSAVWRGGTLEHVSSKELTASLEAAIESIGWDRLNLKPGDIGTHSIRSGAAMAMYLGEIPVCTIMMIGRWSSDAFLRYIRKQVEQFSRNVSNKMILYREFRHVPVARSNSPHERNNGRIRHESVGQNLIVGGDAPRHAYRSLFAGASCA
jgi:hypothetical protein